MKKLFSLLLIASSFFMTSCTQNYSEGNRVGIITKFSQKGLMYKSWEGDLKVAPNLTNQNGMVGQYKDFLFSIDNDNRVECQTPPDSIELYMKLGIPVEVGYQQVAGFNWFQNRGETDYFVRYVKRLK